MVPKKKEKTKKVAGVLNANMVELDNSSGYQCRSILLGTDHIQNDDQKKFLVLMYTHASCSAILLRSRCTRSKL